MLPSWICRYDDEHGSISCQRRLPEELWIRGCFLTFFDNFVSCRRKSCSIHWGWQFRPVDVDLNHVCNMEGCRWLDFRIPEKHRSVWAGTDVQNLAWPWWQRQNPALCAELDRVWCIYWFQSPKCVSICRYLGAFLSKGSFCRGNMRGIMMISFAGTESTGPSF